MLPRPLRSTHRVRDNWRLLNLLGDELSFHRHCVSRIRRTVMGVRVEIEYGESIADGLKRLRRLLHDEGGHPISHAKWHKRRLDRHEKPSILRRRRRWVAVEKRIRGWQSGPADLSHADYFFTFELRPRRLWPPSSVAPDKIRRSRFQRRDKHARYDDS